MRYFVILTFVACLFFFSHSEPTFAERAIEPETHFAQGNEYYTKGLYDEAILEYNKAILINPEYAEAYSNRGMTYFAKGLFNQALEDYNMAIKLNPNLAQAYNNRGNVYSRRGLYKQAIADYNKALELNPELTIVYYNKALACEAVDDIEEAIKSYQYFLQQVPATNAFAKEAIKRVESLKRLLDSKEEAMIHFNRGNEYFTAGLYDKAIFEYSEAIAIYPEYAEAYRARGDVYYRKGLYSEAVNDYDKVTEMNPNLVMAYYNKALALEHIDQKERAIEAYLAFIQHAVEEYSLYIEIAKRRVKALQR